MIYANLFAGMFYSINLFQQTLESHLTHFHKLTKNCRSYSKVLDYWIYVSAFVDNFIGIGRHFICSLFICLAINANCFDLLGIFFRFIFNDWHWYFGFNQRCICFGCKWFCSYSAHIVDWNQARCFIVNCCQCPSTFQQFMCLLHFARCQLNQLTGINGELVRTSRFIIVNYFSCVWFYPGLWISSCKILKYIVIFIWENILNYN